MSLEKVREKIDALDTEIIRLLDERARVCVEIGAIKRELGLPFHQPGREVEVLRRLRALSDGGMPGDSIENIYRVIMAEVTLLQRSGGKCSGYSLDQGKRDVTAEVIENGPVAPGFYRMRLRCPELGGLFAPGQFFQLRLGTEGEGGFLRRPFAPDEYDAAGFSFVYAVVGRGTRYLTELIRGDRVGILAPLGNGYTVPAGMKRAVLIGGGCGAPSLAPLARALRERGVEVTMVMGARRADALLERERCGAAADRLVLATDDGSCGSRGTVVDACRAEVAGLAGIDRVYACGPTPMLRAVAGLASEAGAPCEVSLEERMACGFGACVGCVVPAVSESGTSVYRKVCHDGPVFDASRLAWGDMR